MQELTYRARKILYSVITEYISTGEPVGSRKLARRYGLNLSAASVRNVLADLEDAGFLSQPHSSAGRVPTDAGFRVFVDALVQMREVGADDRAAVMARMQGLTPGADLPREAARLLSSLTGTVSLVAPPRTSSETLTQLRFVPLGQNRVLAVLVTRGEKVQNRIVTLEEDVDPRELEHVHNYLNDIVSGRTLGEVRAALASQMETARGEYVRLSRAMVDAALDRDADEPPEVVIEGQGLLFDRPEFQSAEKIRAFLRTFEEKERLLGLLDRTIQTGGIQVLIGAETKLENMEDVSLVSAAYRQPGGSAGTVGILGPTRMDYAKVVPLVEFTAATVERLLEGEIAEEDEEPEERGG
jgi:heat-inducible transcriptional repressor